MLTDKIKTIKQEDGTYILRHGEWAYVVTKTTSGAFQVGKFSGALKSLKELIKVANDDAKRDLFGGVREIKLPVTPTDEMMEADAANVEVGVWACCHPCALLILWYMSHGYLAGLEETMRITLDLYGWWDHENDCPDVDRASRELETSVQQQAWLAEHDTVSRQTDTKAVNELKLELDAMAPDTLA